MSKTIMIVDNSAALRQVVSMALRDTGYEVVEAADGKDALAKLDGRKLHLIISDASLDSEGISLLKAARQIPDYRFTPFIMLTSQPGERGKLEGEGAGAKAWVVKPFRPAQMVTAVSKLVLP